MGKIDKSSFVFLIDELITIRLKQNDPTAEDPAVLERLSFERERIITKLIQLLQKES